MKTKTLKINADIPVTEQSLEQHNNSSRMPVISIIKQKLRVQNGDLCIKGVPKLIDDKTSPRLPAGDSTAGACGAESAMNEDKNEVLHS